MKNAVAFLIVASISASLMAAPAQQAQVPLFGRTLSFERPVGLVLANEKRNGTHVLVEYIPRGATLGNWTRMVTVQAYRGRGASPAPSAQIARYCRRAPIQRHWQARASRISS
jgi:predicted LPLAT superfamily acyltransferase